MPEIVPVPEFLPVDDSEIQYVSDSDLEDNDKDTEEDTDAGTSSNDVLHYWVNQGTQVPRAILAEMA